MTDLSADRVALLAAINDLSPDVVFAKDRHGRMLYANPAALRLIGKPWAQVEGRTDAEFLDDPVAAATVMANDARIMASGRAEEIEEWVPAPDGSPRLWLSRKMPHLDGAGHVVGLLGVSREITERKRLEDALRASKDHLQRILDSIADGLAVFDRDWNYTYVNAAGARLLGIPVAGLLGRNLWTLFPHAEGSGFGRAYREAMDTGRPTQVEAYYPEPLNMWVEARCFPGPEGLSIFFRDTTERRAAEDALAASEGRLRQVFEASPMGMVTGDSAGRIVTANGAFLRIVGYDEDDLAAGRIRWDVLTPPEMIERDHRAIEEVARRGLSSVYEKEYVRADGSRVPVMLAIARFEGAADLIAFVIDISERKRAEQALADASRRKDEFLAMLAHELRNPLAPIGTAAEILKRAGDAGDARQWAQVIERQVRHLTSLVDDLLDVSRVTRGLVAIERRPVDVQAVVAAALEQAQPLMHARGHAVHTRSAGGPLTVEGDFNRLVQVVANLLGNAAKYTPPGGRVEVGTWREGDEAVVCVADDGCGIDAGLLPAVFDLFTQAERTPDRAQGGLGIGLALVRSLVQLHGGQVEAASDGPGQGCRFTVRLPCVAATDTPAAAVVAEAPPVRRQRLLVVDDNRDAADTLAELLRLLGHEVGVAATGAAALALAGDGAWDACILDIGLPDMTGHELARRLREGPAAAGAIFIALTGYGQAQDRAMSRQAGFDHHLVKPPDAAALLAILGARQPGA